MITERRNVSPPPVVNLRYEKGELIIKEGDYGISIYKILNGKVQIFTRSGDREITLAVLGPGEIIGEMTFLRQGTSTRSASARAVEDSELEAWHPDLLRKEYRDMPPVIKHITDEAMNRLVYMNRLVSQMSARQTEEKAAGGNRNLRRQYYRKEVDLPCTYRPAGSSSKLVLNGVIRNISLTGINLEVKSRTVANFSHDPGDEFHVDFILPKDNEVHLTARIVSFREPRVAGTLSLGMSFSDMTETARKKLGFFLMP